MLTSIADFDPDRARRLCDGIASQMGLGTTPQHLAALFVLAGGRLMPDPAATPPGWWAEASGFRADAASPAGAAAAWLTEVRAALDRAELRCFLANAATLPLDRLADAIRAECDCAGLWLDPAASPYGRPATHCHEISLHGVSARGADPLQAAYAWRKAALAQLVPECHGATGIAMRPTAIPTEEPA